MTWTTLLFALFGLAALTSWLISIWMPSSKERGDKIGWSMVVGVGVVIVVDWFLVPLFAGAE